MRDIIDELVEREDVGTTDPASPNDIAAISKQYDGPLPTLLAKLWRISDGLTLESLNAHILGPVEALELAAGDIWEQGWLQRGFVPVLDTHESNYLMACVHDPLSFRVGFVPHDDAARLIYRDFESCIRGLIEALERGEIADTFLYEAQGDYPPDSPRSEEDQDAARALLATDGEGDAWNYAVQLLDASNLDEWARLLETDHFVRRDVRARMQKMSSPAIRELLRKDKKAFEEFADEAALAAREAGLNVGLRDRETLQVSGKWMNLECFFHRRNIPNAIPRMILWFQDLIAGRNPHDREGHFMKD